MNVDVLRSGVRSGAVGVFMLGFKFAGFRIELFTVWDRTLKVTVATVGLENVVGPESH